MKTEEGFLATAFRKSFLDRLPLVDGETIRSQLQQFLLRAIPWRAAAPILHRREKDPLKPPPIDEQGRHRLPIAPTQRRIDRTKKRMLPYPIITASKTLRVFFKSALEQPDIFSIFGQARRRPFERQRRNINSDPLDLWMSPCEKMQIVSAAASRHEDAHVVGQPNQAMGWQPRVRRPLVPRRIPLLIALLPIDVHAFSMGLWRGFLKHLFAVRVKFTLTLPINTAHIVYSSDHRQPGRARSHATEPASRSQTLK